MGKAKGQAGSFPGAAGGFFKEFGTSLAKGDIFVKLSLIWMGGRLLQKKTVCEIDFDYAF